MPTPRIPRGWLLAVACLTILALGNGRDADPRTAGAAANSGSRPDAWPPGAPARALASAPGSSISTPPAVAAIADPGTRKEFIDRAPATAGSESAPAARTAAALADGRALAPPPPDETRVERIGSVEGPGDRESVGPAPASRGSPRVP